MTDEEFLTPERAKGIRRLLYVVLGFAVVLVVLGVPLVPIWIGLLTAVTGIGLLVVTVSPDKEPR